MKIDLHELYSERLIVLLEDEAQSNKYHQVILNADGFKKVSDAVTASMEKIKEQDGLEVFSMKIGDETITLPSEIKEIHD